MFAILKKNGTNIGQVHRIVILLMIVLVWSLPSGLLGAEQLTIERIVSQPNLTGKAPSAPVWSPDSGHLAFLWNDKAMRFRDVWVVAAHAEAPIRITDMARDFPYPEREVTDSYAKLVQEAAVRSRGGVSSVIWTPDSKSLIISYQGDLFRVDADGKNLLRLTETRGRLHALAFSPDGRFLSYLQEGELWLWNQESGQLIQATKRAKPAIGAVPGASFSKLNAEFSAYKWSPDSRYLAIFFEDRSKVRTVLFPDYLSRETSVQMLRRDYPGDNDCLRALGVYSLDNGDLQIIDLEDKTDRRIDNFSWSPDGSQLLIEQNSENAIHRWIYVVRPEDLSEREVFHDSRESRIAPLWASQWRNNGKAILFLSEKDGYNHLYALSLDNLQSKQLTRGKWSILGARGTPILIASSATKEVYFISTKKNPYERQVYKMPETGGEVTQLTSIPGTHLPFLSPDGKKIALLHSNDVTPTELYIKETKIDSPERRITHSPPKEFYKNKWIAPQYVTFKSHVDGVTLHGRLLLPLNLDESKKYPVVLGPVYSNTVRNSWQGRYGLLQQYLALEGQYIVMLVDIRGSSGYGHTFRDKFKFDAGGIDIEDLHSGVKYLKTLPYVDSERIGIWGSSYGGLLTMMSLFKKPGIYKAGVAGAPGGSWHALTRNVSFFGRPETHPEIYRKGSCLSFGEELKDYLMIIHGMQDSVVLFKDSVDIVEKLMMLEKNFDFVVAPSATHGWSRKDYVALYLFKKLVGHFDRYLGRGPK